ncbi:hypothetical protein SERLA73DRAFT_180205 [Serpula lacrymans var. lacrymans S7.3]|uniref:Uncharacterized protein n=2 Tax=Serpula lacrymans var. lacrymans TaxID=341189 RepID=F8PWA3_SERL3|nr:uncharacterized protein SERLADRAFT_465705 [Serpula lacrymans var. lacrymans S7.9]EGN99908.1 hypothetical protein SERLA73DRAFT_180205 [Serpula lacrymans var. lacrymans S7.3]EGO25474.1 hypothetical protein SERLADRAFT_465705 [Serpula lacrymans var. lacrymans S7.9]
MSYASIAAHDAPPPSQQPHANPSLLNTHSSSVDNIADDASKVNVVSSDFRETPATYTSENRPPEDFIRGELPSSSGAGRGKKNSPGSRRLQEAEAEGAYLWQLTKHYLFRPGVAGGLLGLVNVGLLSAGGYAFYTRPDLRRDRTAISSAIASTLLLLSAEGYAAEKHLQTPMGREEEHRARQEGMLFYTSAREHILRPGVLGGLVGLVNVAVLGTVGYLGLINWDRQRWDRQIVSIISVGLLSLWGAEGYLAERFRKEKR